MFDKPWEKPKILVSLISLLVVELKWKPKKISSSSFTCWELSHVNSFIFFSLGVDRRRPWLNCWSGSYMHCCWINQRAHIGLSSPVYWMLADSILVQCTRTLIIIHIIRSSEWKAIMRIYDGLIGMRKAGMNSTSLVFVNMMSSSFLSQLLWSKHICNDI